MYFNNFLLLICSLPIKAHIFMQFPPSRRSKYSEYYTDNKLVDYNLMAPLNTYGYIFPCKGFSQGPPTHTFYSNTIKVILEGSATHGGGHCQFGITYNDHDFLVLKTVIRSCLIDRMTYDFQLPDNTPDGKVTVFWTLVNAIGNREYYMECADILLSNNAIWDGEPLNGKELIIADIDGHQIIPEFPYPGMYDGRELFMNAQPFSLYPLSYNQPPPIPYVTKQQPPQQTEEYPQQTAEPVQEKTCYNIGELKCNGNGFNTCIYGNWVFRECAPGTTCKQLKDTIICDF